MTNESTQPATELPKPTWMMKPTHFYTPPEAASAEWRRPWHQIFSAVYPPVLVRVAEECEWALAIAADRLKDPSRAETRWFMGLVTWMTDIGEKNARGIADLWSYYQEYRTTLPDRDRLAWSKRVASAIGVSYRNPRKLQDLWRESLAQKGFSPTVSAQRGDTCAT